MLNILQNIKDYASLIFAILMFSYALVSFIVGLTKSRHRKLSAQEENEDLKDELEESKQEYSLINEIIPLAIKQAEEMTNLDGPTKKLIALSRILLTCNEQGIDFELFKDFINEQIESLIVFSKTINKRKEDDKGGLD